MNVTPYPGFTHLYSAIYRKRSYAIIAFLFAASLPLSLRGADPTPLPSRSLDPISVKRSEKSISAIDAANAFTQRLGIKSDKEYFRTWKQAAALAEQQLNVEPKDRVSIAVPSIESSKTSTSITMDNTFLGNLRRLAQDKILGGTEISDAGFQNCVAVGYHAFGRQFLCSGTLIAEHLVLTASHCTRTNNPDFVLFCNNIADSTAREVKVRNLYACGNNIDLLLLELDERVTNVQPAQIATKEIPDGFPDVQPSPDFGKLELVGFGATDEQGNPSTYGQKRFAFVAIAADDPNRLGYKQGLEFAAGKRASDKDTCPGDSGGPGFLQLTANNQTLLLGCTSRPTATPPNAPPDKKCGDGGVYVRVDKQIQWIQQIAASVNSTLP